MIRLSIASDNRLFRDALAAVLAARPEIDLVGVTSRDAEALVAVSERRCDVVVIDATNGLAPGTASSDAASSAVKILRVGVHDAAEAAPWLRAGASGYLLSDGSLDDLVDAIERVARGEFVGSADIVASLLAAASATTSERSGNDESRKLTLREREIAELLEQGLSNKQIAQRLAIGLATVKTHVRNIIEKLHATSRTQAAVRLRTNKDR